MTQSVLNNSSIFQPVIDFTQQCKIKTLNLFAPLPPKDKESRMANIARRIIFICTLILPMIGLIAAGFSECCSIQRPVTPPPPRPTPPAPQTQTAAPLVVTANQPATVPKSKTGLTVGELREILMRLETIEPETLIGNDGLIENYKTTLRNKIIDKDPLKFKKNEVKTIFNQCLTKIHLVDEVLGLKNVAT